MELVRTNNRGLFVINAPAKVNLALHVVGQREDGYHLLETLVVFTEFADRVKIAPSDRERFTVLCQFAGKVPTGRTNLVLRARDALRQAFPQAANSSVAIKLEKNLPPASGIGGGSSDAAATLRALASLWGVKDERILEQTALALGADVPMCLSSSPALVSGIGEKVERVPDFPPLFIVLVNPGVEVSTSAVFSRLKAKANPPLKPPVPSDRQALYAWLGETRNDLQPPALELAPIIGEALAALSATRARFVRMSGSGATCFGLYDRKEQAETAATEIRRTRPEWFVAATESFAASGEDNAGN